jgi:hydrogenase expression/formation protein HypE
MADFTPACPIPITDYPNVLLAHGGGGRLMHQLIDRMLRPSLDNPLLAQGHDGAVFQVDGARLAFTTDSYVVQPLFFPGGDIGQLAVHGTVNDLAMCGARPLYLSLGLIVEEGFPMDDLWRVVQSISQAARSAGVQIVTGDTKVVDRGKGDGIFINTAGLGLVAPGVDIDPAGVRPGDCVILSGDVGRHGIAIMAQREGLDFESVIESDTAPLVRPVMALLDSGAQVRCLRDLTRGGLASALIEVAQSSRVRIDIDEGALPVRDDVRGACEILGLDPMYVANEGRFVAFVPEADAPAALAALQSDPLGAGATIIGEVVAAGSGQVTVKTPIGGRRILDMLSGEQLPRIC